MVGQRAPLETRFWSKVQKGTGKDCWLWTGTKNNKGYGLIGRGAAALGKALAHRVSYELHYGPIPAGPTPQSNIVMHACDNPACVNPAHLRLGTMKANYADMAEKGRRRVVCSPDNRPPHLQGEEHGMAKLTEADVAGIRARRMAREPYTTIAADFGVNKSTIRKLCLGVAWGNVPVSPALAAVNSGGKARRITDADRAAIPVLAAQGLSPCAIGKRLGCDHKTVRKHLP